MKRLYWRPPGVSRTALVLVALISIAVMAAVEHFPLVVKQERYGDKIAAARLARKCMEAIKTEKERLGHPTDLDIDPAGTGMIGESLTAVTSNTGYLAAKLTSTNPNFAALVLHLLDEAGIGEGDTVAVGMSGSFPSLNLSTYAALEIIGAKPITIASSSSSEWGANHVDYVWLDMERTLREQGLIPFQAAGASYGGIDDVGLGITKKGRAMLDAAIARNGVTKLDPKTLAEAIDQRMALYDEIAGDRPIKAYINVGGGSASVGTHVGKKQFKPGLNREPPRSALVPDSVMLRFAKRDLPVIHMSRVKLLTERYGMPYEPHKEVPIGQGNVFIASEYNRWLALVGLLVVIGVLMAFLRWDVGTRMLRGVRAKPDTKAPEQMV